MSADLDYHKNLIVKICDEDFDWSRRKFND